MRSRPFATVLTLMRGGALVEAMQFYQSGVGLNLALAQGRDLGQVFHLQLAYL